MQKDDIYKEIFDFSPVAIVLLDKNGDVMDLNNRVYEWLGYTREEIIGKNLMELPYLPQKSKDIVKEKFTKRMSGEEVHPYELEFVDKTGKKNIFASIEALPIRNEKGEIIKDLVMISNITEQKEYKKQALHIENKYKSLIDSLPQRIFLKDKNGVYLSCNSKYSSDLHINEEDIIGKTDYDFYEKELAEKYRADDKKVIEEMSIVDIEERYIKDGQELIVETTKVPFNDDKGNVLGVLGIFRDITDIVNTKQDLQRTSKQLLKAEKLANLGKLAGAISHELRNPLGVIKNAVYFLERYADKIDRDTKMKYLNMINRNVEVAVSIINESLSFAKEMQLNIRETKISEIIKDVSRDYDMYKNIEFIIDLKEDPMILIDPYQIRKVFTNIIQNSVHAIEDKGIIRIKSKIEDECLVLVVEDNGCGIDKKYLEEIFEPLFTTKSRGIGLGLYIVQNIIRKHGGEIHIDSEYGKGTKTIIKLKMVQ